MTLRVPAQGQRILLDAALARRPQEDLEVRLFRNFALDLGSLTERDLEEPDVAGYAPIPLQASAWREDPGVVPLTYVHPAVQFRFDGAAGRLFGYYIAQRGSGRLVGWETFVQPVNGRRRGDRVTVVPRLSVVGT